MSHHIPENRLGASLNAAEVSKRLGLVDIHAAWVEAVEQTRAPELTIPDSAGLSALLEKLGISGDDAAEVIRRMPSPLHYPEAWWLLERTGSIFTSHLANRETAARRSGVHPQPAADWPVLLQSLLSPLPASLRFFPVHLIIASLSSIRDCHSSFGIPDDISWNTLSAVGGAMTEYRRKHAEAGIHLTPWNWLRFLGWMYEVGRLEVAHYRIRTHPKEAGPLFWYDDEIIGRLGPGFRLGDPALSIHVPASEPLTPQAFEDSLHRMRTDFMGIYPGETMRVATCTSWLLDEQLAEYLSPSSNIVTFQKRFNMVPGARDDEAIVQAVFGRQRPPELEELPQGTALERAVVRHLRQGRRWRVRTGWVDLSN